MVDQRARPPAGDELEVSIFGPGKGECIVVHVPGGYWFAVDSFVARTDGGTKVPVAMHYLQLLHAELRALFVTHWHADHTGGAAELVRAFAPSLERIGLPGGINERELCSFLADLLPDASRFRPVRDLVALLSAMREPPLAHVHPVLLNDGTRLDPPGASWSLEALSPSMDDVRHQALTLAKFLPEYIGVKPRSFDVNSGCVVLRLEVDGRVVMLMSDLDIGEDDGRGWRCIVKHHGSRLNADLVKVGHHGSTTAHHPPAWDCFRTSEPTHGVVTPFPARGERLPRESDLKRIRVLTTTLHVTAQRTVHAPKRAGAVKLKDTPFSNFLPTKSPHAQALGHVRYRWPAGAADCTIEVFKPALRVA